MEIIDTHAYQGTNEALRIDYGLECLVRVRQQFSGHNLRFLAMSASEDANHSMADLVKGNPDFFVGAVLQVVPRKDLASEYGLPFRYVPPEEISDLLMREEIKGLKVITSTVKTPVDSPLLEPYIELAIQKGIPILFHCCSDGMEKYGEEFTSYNQKLGLVQRHPDLKVVLVHFGGLNLGYVNESISLAEQFPNVYLNTSGMSGEVNRWDTSGGSPRRIPSYNDPEMRMIWERELRRAMQNPVVRRKIVFGTDYPELKFDLHPLDKLSPEDQEQIMQNARTLFQLG